MRSLFYSLLLVATSLPILVYGQGKVYSPLVNIPGNGANGFEEYISFLYGASISVAALLAVVKIIIAGAKYMMSDVITNKGEALSDIQGAILGLLLILGAVIILEFINPQLIKRDIKFQAIAPPPTINARNSVSAALANSASVLLTGCGTRRDLSDENFVIVGFNATTCSEPAGALGIFAQQCRSEGGTLDLSRSAELISVCAIPKTGLGAGNITPSVQYTMGSYDDSHNFCSAGENILYGAAGGVGIGIACYQELVLSDTYIDRKASVGATIVYDAEKSCKEELPEDWWAGYLDKCVEVVKDLLFETCSVQPGESCDSGWCKHNAGREVSGAGLRKFSCELPYQRFTREQVLTKYREITATAQQDGTASAAAFGSGCTALGGQTVNIGLEYVDEDELVNLRCVKR